MEFPIKTERLLIRPMDLEDAEFILDLFGTKDWIEKIGDRGLKTVEDAEEHIRSKTLKAFNKQGIGAFTLTLRSTGKKIGITSIVDRPSLEHPDIGFGLLPEYYKKGYGYEASIPTIAYARKQLNTNILQAITIESNIGSQRLLEKLDFKFRRIIRIPEDDEDLMLFELLT